MTPDETDAEVARLREQLASVTKAKDDAYSERNQLVALLARVALAMGWKAGVREHPAEDTAWENDWRTVVFIDLPTGQASWHFHDSEKHLLDGLRQYVGQWDGHTTPQKYERVRAALAPAADAPKPAEPAKCEHDRTRRLNNFGEFVCVRCGALILPQQTEAEPEPADCPSQWTREAVDAEVLNLRAQLAAAQARVKELEGLATLANSGRAQLEGWRDSLEAERDEANARAEREKASADKLMAAAKENRVARDAAILERDTLKAECASISAEFGLPPTMRPAEGAIQRILKQAKDAIPERDAAIRERDDWNRLCQFARDERDEFRTERDHWFEQCRKITADYQAERKAKEEALAEVTNILFEECQPNNGDLFSRMDDRIRALAKEASKDGGA